MDIDTLKIIFTAVLFIIMLTVTYYQSENNKQFIRNLIKQSGGSKIKISRQLFNGSRGAYTYRVVFIDTEGNSHQTQCMITKGNLYWTRSPAALLAGFQEEAGNTNQLENRSLFPNYEDEPELDSRSDKEKLMDSLTSPFRHERKLAAENAANFGQIDEGVVHLLQEIAHSDSEEIVRTAASETLQTLNRS
jgi:hypothetical protein